MEFSSGIRKEFSKELRKGATGKKNQETFQKENRNELCMEGRLPKKFLKKFCVDQQTEFPC